MPRVSRLPVAAREPVARRTARGRAGRLAALAAAVALIAAPLAACTTGSASTAGSASASSIAGSADEVPALDPAGWTASTYESITRLIEDGAGTGQPVAFDFDNTTQARDVSEALIGYVEQSGALAAGRIPPSLVPPVVVDGTKVTIADGPATYYAAVADSGGDEDPFREFASLPLIADVFAGSTVAEMMTLMAKAYDKGAGARELATGAYETLAGMGRPAVYPQMADLYGNLRAHGYDVWVVSAAIGWPLRYMVKNELNPMIVAKYGAQAALPPDHVIAIFNLMRDTRTGEFVSDYQLATTRHDQAYLDLDPERLSQLEILALPGGIASWRGGKVAAVRQQITAGPLYLAAGDSFGDMEMLALADNRLVITRMDKPNLAEAYAQAIEASPDVNWLLQPVISSAPAGFLPTSCVMDAKTASLPDLRAKTEASMAALSPTGMLGSFPDC